MQFLRHIDEQGRVRDIPLKNGREGNVQTLKLAAEEVRKHHLHEPMRSLAASILVNKGVRERDPLAEVTAIFEAVRDKIRWQRDQVELGDKVQAPEYTAKRGYGDCVDQSILLATLLAALGYRNVRFAAISFDGIALQHVFLEVLINDRWTALDPTPDRAAVGWSADSKARFYFPIFDKGTKGDPANLGGFWSTVIGSAVNLFAPGAGNPILQSGAQKDAEKAAKFQLEQQLEQVDTQLGNALKSLEAQLDANQIDAGNAIAQANAILAAWQQAYPQFSSTQGAYAQNVNTSVTGAAARIISKAQAKGTAAVSGATVSSISAFSLSDVPLWAWGVLVAVILLKR